MKTYIICCVCCTNPIFGKIWLQKWPDFLHVDSNSHKLSFFGWAVRNGSGQSGHGTLKLTVSQE